MLWALNALEEQTLDRGAWEVVVVHDYPAGVADRILGQHPLTETGVLREIRVDPAQASPAYQRNLGWRASRAPAIAFTDDDCRPSAEWLAELLRIHQSAPDAIVQGRTRPDPFETAVYGSPHARSLWVDPPEEFAQTCNILYPRAALERVDGFDETLPAPAGEDTDLALRVRACGAALVPAPAAVVFHAVEAYSLAGAVRVNRKWQHLAYVVKRHPDLRGRVVGRVFWRRSHAEVLAFLLGLAVARRHPLVLTLTMPWLRRRLLRRGTHKGALVAGLVELPGGLVVDVAEVVTMAEGSIRYRTVLL